MRTLHVNDLITAYAAAPMTLGEQVLDDKGDLWRLVKGREDLLFGEVVRPALVLAAAGTVTTAAPVNTNRLIDTSYFASLTAADLIGARGRITSSLATGGGQGFVITDRVSDDEVIVQVTSYNSAADVGAWSSDGLWEVALTTSSTFTINLPGHVEDAVEGFPATGVCLVNGGVDVSALPYFYVKQTGIAPCLVDTDDNTIIDGEVVSVSASTNGYIQGPNASTAPTNAELVSQVGYAFGGDPGFDGAIMEVDLYLSAIATQSHKLTRRVHPYNEVTI